MLKNVNASKWYDGVGLPSDLIGADGDYYLQISNSDIFRKSHGSWLKIGNIKGSKGDKGLTGNTGDKGEDGRHGSVWFCGVGYPNNELGEEDDFFLDLDSKDIFKKQCEVWERVGSLLPDGRKIELRNINGGVEYRYEGESDESWKTIITNEEIKGDMPSIDHLEQIINDKIVEIEDVEKSIKSQEVIRQEQELGRQQSIMDMKLSVDEKLTEVDTSLAEYEVRFSELEFGTVVGEVEDARTSVLNGTKYNTLRERLDYDFNRKANNSHKHRISDITDLSMEWDSIINKPDIATKEYVDYVIEGATSIDDNVIDKDTTWSSFKIKQELNGLSSGKNVSNVISILSDEWAREGNVFRCNVVHNLNSERVILDAVSTATKESIFVSYRVIDANTIEVINDTQEDITVLIVNAQIPIEENNTSINDDLVGKTLTWSSSKITSELNSIVDNIVTDAIGTTYDNSVSGISSNNVQGAIDESYARLNEINESMSGLSVRLEELFNEVNGQRLIGIEMANDLLEQL